MHGGARLRRYGSPKDTTRRTCEHAHLAGRQQRVLRRVHARRLQERRRRSAHGGVVLERCLQRQHRHRDLVGLVVTAPQQHTVSHANSNREHGGRARQ